MRKFRLTLLLISFLGIFSACKKDDEGTPVSRTASLLTRPKTWKVTGFTINPGVQLQQDGPIVTDLYNAFGSTYQDNTIKFTLNPNIYLIEEGTTKDQFDGQIGDVGEWYIGSDEKSIVLASKASSLTSCDILELTETTFQYRYIIFLGSQGQPFTITQTYTAQ